MSADQPSFVVIGAARCATTSMHAYLDAHPDVSLSSIKEINFFSNNRFYDRGFDWYRSHFHGVSTPAIGEASTSYTAAVGPDERVPQRLRKHLGNAKLLYLVRDPIQRLVSHYLHYQHRGERVAELSALVNSPLYEDTRWQGRYHHQLSLYRRYFDMASILVVSVDDLRDAPQATMSRVFAHIGAEPGKLDLADASSMIHNSSSKSTQKTAAGRWLLSRYARYLEPARVPYKLKAMVRKTAEIGSTPLDLLALPEDDYAKLKGFYQADSLALQDEYEIDTSGWLAGPR